ncbi:MAG: hypothetical protein ACRDRH_14330 [Pseudonocardia sp.]
MSPPDGRHWWPYRDAEPGPEVGVVVLYGDEPGFLRMERVDGGWHSQGVAAPYPELTPPQPWAATGRCWAGAAHPVMDATQHITPQRPAPAVRNRP